MLWSYLVTSHFLHTASQFSSLAGKAQPDPVLGVAASSKKRSWKSNFKELNTSPPAPWLLPACSGSTSSRPCSCSPAPFHLLPGEPGTSQGTDSLPVLLCAGLASTLPAQPWHEPLQPQQRWQLAALQQLRPRRQPARADRGTVAWWHSGTVAWCPSFPLAQGQGKPSGPCERSCSSLVQRRGGDHG